MEVMRTSGRPKKYKSKKALYEAVEDYFASICCTITVHNEIGDVVVNDLGDPIIQKKYVVPPTISGLCLRLGIDRRTWNNYCDEKLHPEFQIITSTAKARIEAWLEEELICREKNVRGVIFNLQNNFGWREKKEMELGGETRKVMAAESLSLEEKLRLIEETAAEMQADGIANGGTDEEKG